MFRSLFFWSVVLLGVVPATAQNLISNVKSWQDPGTHTVKITYDLSTSAACTIALQASDDGGESYGLTLPADALSGDVGAKYYNAGTRTIVLDASKVDQLKSTFTKNLRFKVVVTGVVVPEMVLIPAGTFQMGDNFNEGWIDQRPVHSVSVSAFYLQNTEVTKAQWDAVRAWGLNNGYTDLPVGGGKAANHPVHSINWYAMVKWCNARSQMENLTPCYGATYKTGWDAYVGCNWNANGYRLPTEAEWEKAARGGLSGKRFPWGDTISHSVANYRVLSSNGTTNYYSYDVTLRPPGTVYDYYHPAYNDGVSPFTSPVGSFAPNGYGLYDMAGNLYEWCWDRYSDSYYSTSPGTDPRGGSGRDRVYRGGSWFHSAPYCRVARRNRFDDPGDTSNGVGFRPARSSVP